ncbi:MAG: exodeoxyribonuclease V subunit gamma [Candidatus Sedimenticola endophacoides]
MLRLYQSNRLERLSERLAEVFSDPLDDPLATESVVVQHPGMGRWLALRLADRQGICANVEFVQPAAFIWCLLESLLPDVPQQTRYHPGVLTWSVFRHLGELRQDPAFEAVATYFQGTGEREQFQLATRIAGCLDQYLVYRPDWISHWEAGRPALLGDAWQSELWRRLSAGARAQHWVAIQRRLHRMAQRGEITPADLPRRVALFGIASLSPGFLSLVALLGRFTEVHLFLLNPCQAHWSEIVSEREAGRLALEGEPEELYLEVGHPLLASMGQQGRDFFSLLQEFDPGSEELFESPEGESMLGRIQRDILELNDPSQAPAALFDPADRSIQVHAAHSPMREVEVLRDQLLGLLDEDPGLRPRDILVMTPDMDTYAPFMEAVFNEREGALRLPFTLADRSLIGQSPLVDAFMRLLQLPGGRYAADEVLALLEVAAVQRRFGIGDGDLPLIAEWVEQAGIRWGRDASTRRALGLPETDQNSWRAGLDRLLLGLALPEQRLFRGVAPFTEVEGSQGLLVGGLCGFAGALFSLETLLGGRHPPPRWAQRLSAMLDRFFLPTPEEEPQLQGIRDTLGRIAGQAACAGFEQPVELALIRELLSGQFLTAPAHTPFLGGGITFCALTPMRSLPFRVICMIGLDDGAFPRDRRPPGFDLMADHRRAGDRSHRADDRYLFLESLISARRHLYLSYVGQDIRDNTHLPPSTLVSELLDLIDRTHSTGDGSPVSDQLLVRHPLQPFSRRYFTGDPRLFSYAHGMYRAASAVTTGTPPRRRLVDGVLPEPEARWRQLELGQLVRFFEHPVRYFIQQRLGVRLGMGERLLDTRDPFELDYLEQRALQERLVRAYLGGEGTDELLALERAAGVLPHGVVGERCFHHLAQSARELAARLAPLADLWTCSLDLDFEACGMRLRGRLDNVSREGVWGYSVKPLPEGRLLGLWVRHLALNLCAPPDLPPETRWFHAEGELRFLPVVDAGKRLEALLDLYWQGLMQPLPLFPKASLRYAEALRRGKAREQCLKGAWERWGSERNPHPESSDRYHQLAFPDGDALDPLFEAVADGVYGGMLEHLEISG